jgi:hypothetical protein
VFQRNFRDIVASRACEATLSRTLLRRKSSLICRVSVLVFALAASGCARGEAGPADRGARGTLHGQIKGVGGPPPGKERSLPGTVLLTRGDEVVGQQTVSRGVEYRFTLRPGSYRVRVKNIRGCTAGAIVKSSLDTRVDVVCQLK